MGWIVDLFRMKHLVKDCNEQRVGKSLGTAYILGLPPLGIFGAYHYYLGNIKLGLIYTFTFGIFGIGWIVDLFRMSTLVRKARLDKKSVGTSYIMAMPPFGLFGAHHYYLGNYFLGILYTCTLGIFTIGWIVDLFRMKDLVKASNDPTSDYGTTKVTAYIMCVSPLGIFGVHHFYLQRYLNGVLYALTLGLFGFGWIFDMLRLPVLYDRYADEDKHKYPDEAYLFWFPFGLFGLHYFYLENNKWGILYACTLGCFGVGWIIDGVRMLSLVKDYNKYVQDPDMNNFRICRPNCRSCSVYKCKRCCLDMFSCGCFANFSLSRSVSKRDTNVNGDARPPPRDDFDVIKEMYPNENHGGYDEIAASVSDAAAQETEGNICTVQESYDTYPTDQTVSQAYDNATYSGDPGNDDQPENELARGNLAYPPPPQEYRDCSTQNNEHEPNTYACDEQYTMDNSNYQYDDNYPAEEERHNDAVDIRHHEDVNVTVHNGDVDIPHQEDVNVTVHNDNEQYEMQNQQNYDQANKASDRYDDTMYL